MTTLYRFRSTTGELLYVGITDRAVTRWSEHARGKEWWPAVASVEVSHFLSRAEAREAELNAIRNEAPVHNIADSPRPPAISANSLREIERQNLGAYLQDRGLMLVVGDRLDGVWDRYSDEFRPATESERSAWERLNAICDELVPS